MATLDNQQIQDPSTKGIEGIKGLEGINRLKEKGINIDTSIFNLANDYRGTMNEIYQSATPRQNIGFVGINDSMFDDEITSASQLDNLSNTRGELQPWYAQISAGLAKGVVLAGTTFLDGTLGLLFGIGEATRRGFDDDYTKSGTVAGLWDNPFSKAMQSINEWSEKALPNYYTDAERNEPWYENIFTANFLGDKFIKNLGFTVGAFYSGGVSTAGLKATKLPQIIGAVAKSSRAPAIVTSGVGATISAVNEGRIEALNNSTDWFNLHKTQLDDQHTARLQAIDSMYLDPEMHNRMITQENANYEATLGKLTEDRLKMGNADLLMNIPILTASNLIQFGRMYANGFKTARKATNIVGKPGEYATGRTTGKGIAIATLSPLSEGTEEISQKAVATISGLAYEQDVNNFYKAKINPEAEQQTIDWIKAFAQGINETVNDGSSWEEFFIGTLTGALGMPKFRGVRNSEGRLQSPIILEGGVVGKFKEYKKQMKRDAEIADYMNNRVQSPEFKNYYQGLIRHNKYQNDMNQAVENNDEFEFKNAEHAQLISDIAMFDNAGKLEDLTTLINSAYNTSDENLAAIVENTTSTVTDENGKEAKVGPFINKNGNPMYSTPEGKQEMIGKLTQTRDEMLNTITNYTKIKDDIDVRTGQQLSDEQLEELTWLKSQIGNWQSRANQLSNEVKPTIGTVLGSMSQLADMYNSIKNKEGKTYAGLSNLYNSADKNERQIRKNMSILETVRDLDDKTFAYLLSSDSKLVEGIKSVIESPLSGVTADDAQVFNEKIDDIVKLVDATGKYNTKLKEYLENPAKLQEDIVSSTENIAKEEAKKKFDNLKSRLLSATNLSEFRQTLNKEEDATTREEVLKSLEDEGNEMAKNYKEVNAYNTDVQRAINSLDESPAVKADALKLLQDQFENSSNLNEIGNPNSIYINNADALYDDNLTPEENAVKFQEAQYALLRAMNQINNENKFKNRFSPEYKKPVDNRRNTIVNRVITKSGKTVEGTYTKTKDKDGFIHGKFSGPGVAKFRVTPASTGLTLDELIGSKDEYQNEDSYNGVITDINDGGLTIDSFVVRPDGNVSIITDNQITIEGKAAKEIYNQLFNPTIKGDDRTTTGDSGTSTVPPVSTEGLPVVTYEPPVGNVTATQVKDENRETNSMVETPQSLDSKQKSRRPYYRPSIPELHIQASKEGDFRPFNVVAAEREKGVNFDELYNYLRDNGAFTYVNEGNLKAGDELGFMIDPSFNDHTIFIIDRRNNQIVGSLDESDYSVDKYEGLAGLEERIRNEYNNRVTSETIIKDGITYTNFTIYRKTKSGEIKAITQGSAGITINPSTINEDSLKNIKDYSEIQLVQLREKDGKYKGTIRAKSIDGWSTFEVHFNNNPINNEVLNNKLQKDDLIHITNTHQGLQHLGTIQDWSKKASDVRTKPDGFGTENGLFYYKKSHQGGRGGDNITIWFRNEPSQKIKDNIEQLLSSSKDLNEFGDKVTELIKDTQSKGKFIATPTTRVSKVMVGKIPYGNTERSLKDIPNVSSTDRKPIFGIIKNGVLTTNSKIDDSLIIKPVDMSQKEGRLYLLIPNGAGKYSPAAVRVKHFNKTEFNPEDVEVQSTQVYKNIQESIDALANSLSEDDLNNAVKSLATNLYTGDLHIDWFTSDSGNGIRFTKVQRDAQGNEIYEEKDGKRIRKETVKTVFLTEKWDQNTLYSITGNEEVQTEPASKSIEDVSKEISEIFLDFNLPIQVNLGMLNKGGYNNILVNSNILTSNISDARVLSNWFTTDYFDNEGNLHQAVSPASVTPQPTRKVETPVGGKEGAITGIKVVVDGATYGVDLTTGVIYGSNNQRVYPKNAQLISDLAWASASFGDATNGSLIWNNKILLPSGQVLDRGTKKYLTGEEAQEVKDKIAGRERTVADSKKVIAQIAENQKKVDKTRTDSEFYYILEEDGQYHEYKRVHSRLGSNWVESKKQTEALKDIKVRLSQLADNVTQYNNYLKYLNNYWKVNLDTFSGKIDAKSRDTIVNIIRDSMNGTNSQRALNAGTAVDSVIRNFFTSNDTPVKPDNMSEKAFTDLIASLTEIRSNIEARGERFLTNNIVLFQKYADGTRVAGEVDILSVDADGNFRIYDVKTSRYSFYDFTDRYGNRVNYFTNPSATQRMSAKDYYTLQLSAYKNLFESQYHTPITTLAVLPFVLNYNKDVVDGVTKEKGIMITYNPAVNVPLVGAVRVSKSAPTNSIVPVFNSALETQDPVNNVLPEYSLEDSKVGYFVRDGKLHKSYLTPIDKVNGVDVYMAKIPTITKGFDRQGEEAHVASNSYMAVFPNGNSITLIKNDPMTMTEQQAKNTIKKMLNGNPQRVVDMSNEKTLIFDPASAPVVEAPKTETPSTILSTPTESGAAKAAQAEQAINENDDEFEDDLDLGNLRRVDDETRGTWNQEKELTWIKKVLPQLSDNDRVRVVKGLIRVGNQGVLAWGQFDGSIITLSDIAAEGTTYHEAFHVVFNLLLDQNERTSLLNEYRKKHPNMDNLSLEEELAEDFREFVMQGGKDTRSLGRKIIDFFKSLFIKTKYWKDFRPSSIYYFKAINDSKYSKKNIPFTTSNNNKYKQEEYTQEMKDILAKAPRDSQGRLLAPNGKPSNLTEKQYAQVRTKAFKDWFGDWEEGLHIYQDNKSYYRGQYEEPIIDKNGNLILKGRKDPLYEKAGYNIEKGVSATTDMISANEYGINQKYAYEADIEDKYGELDQSWEKEQLLNEVAEHGYYLIQFPKNIANQIINEAGEVKIVGDIVIPKGQYIIEHITDEGTEVLATSNNNASKVVDENGEPLVVYHGTSRILNNNSFNSEFIFASDNDIIAAGYSFQRKGFSVGIDYALSDFAGEDINSFRNHIDNHIKWLETEIELGKDMPFYQEGDLDAKKNLIKELKKAKQEIKNRDIFKEFEFNIFNLFQNARNPLIVDAKEKYWHSIEFEGTTKNTNEIAKIAKDRGYDGLIITNVIDKGTEASKNEEYAEVANDYIVFNSNQIKSATDNIGTFDSNNPDIRYRKIPSIKELRAQEKSMYDKYNNDIEEEYREAVEIVNRLNYKRFNTPEEAMNAFNESGIRKDFFYRITRAGANNAVGYKIQLITRAMLEQYKIDNNPYNENYEDYITPVENFYFDSLDPEIQIMLFDKGWTKEEFDSISQEERDVAVECIYF